MVEAGDDGQTQGFKACVQRRPSIVGRGQVSLHARRVALGKRGYVALDEAEEFVVDEGVDRLPPFSRAIPQIEPAFTLVVDRDRLLRALRGHEEQVRLSAYAVGLGILELSSAGAYTIVLVTSKGGDGEFWRPEIQPKDEKEAPPRGG
ncbi:MAG: hypothetical protein IPM39_09425 [Chloroflexi bacterium]|nr:hypothetical protein [Chloroflexota bacterium]